EFNDALVKMNELDFKDLVNGLVDWRLISEGEREKEGRKGEEKVYITHPLIKGYFESTFEEKDKKLCHKRLYQYFGEIAPGRPETLEEMQPLFEQVYHGCEAEMYQEAFDDVYWQKVQRGEEGFLIYKLGAWGTNLSLVQNFFQDEDLQKEPLVSRIEGGYKSCLINEAGLSMNSLGRLKEAEGLYKRTIELAISQRDWMNASMGYQNLAGLQIRTGSLLQAKRSSEKANRLSRKAENVVYEYASTAYLAYTLFLLGEMDKAGIEFEKADELEKKANTSKRHRYSGRGIRYADFLLAQGKIQSALDVTNENLRICKEYNLIDYINLCHRSLASIYRHLKDFKEAEANAAVALEGAKKTGRQDIIAESLIELARIKTEQGQYPEAESALNQALRICQRCGFKLYEIDAELILAKTYLAQNDLDQAKSFAQSASSKAKGMSYQLAKNEAEYLLAEMKKD
ncbi:tetratricopeptide repeat protein, partial [bacterium]|nr:tetratricopeptide repeat protein [bacterium]